VLECWRMTGQAAFRFDTIIYGHGVPTRRTVSVLATCRSTSTTRPTTWPVSDRWSPGIDRLASGPSLMVAVQPFVTGSERLLCGDHLKRSAVRCWAGSRR
jgi:hypothetical protein